ncbi:MAG: HNH endonuclease [Chthoniobacterales bacterium]|nr:HNH endonuclease [Chthoniobacterales bacterium]
MQRALDHPVLVLNRLWQAVNTCSVRRAFGLLFVGHAQVVHAENGSFDTYTFHEWHEISQQFPRELPDCEWVRTIHFRIRVPKVIVLTIFDHLPLKEVKLTRLHVFERDQYICQYCHQRFEKHELNIDHVVPRVRGGKTTWENVVTSCIRCNTRKGNRLPHEAGMRLLKLPAKPKMRPFLCIHQARDRHPDWLHFLDFSRWKVELSA